MKLAGPVWRAQWEVHAWVGAVASLLLFVLCFCGIFALYRRDIGVWQEPALQVAGDGAPVDWSAIVADAGALPPGATVGIVRHPPSRLVKVTVWADGDERSWHLDPATGTRHAPRSRLADELYHLHYLEPAPLGPELAGLVALALAVASVTGLVIHLKDVPVRTWTFRPDGRRRFVASDAHKILGLFGLPFAVVFGWSGAALGWFDLQTELFARLGYAGDTARVEALRGYAGAAREATGRPAAALAPEVLVARAARATGMGAVEPAYLDLFVTGDEAAWASVFWEVEGFPPRAWAWVDARTGDVFGSAEASATVANRLDMALFDLHYARYAGRLVQGAYAVLALALAAVALTGNLVWLDRRDPRRERLGNRILERATVGVPAGLVLACGVAFLANRLSPSGGADVELGALYGTWAVVAAVAMVPAVGTRRILVWTAGAATVAYLAAAVAPDAGRLEPVVVTDALLAALGLGCGAVALGVRGGRP